MLPLLVAAGVTKVLGSLIEGAAALRRGRATLEVMKTNADIANLAAADAVERGMVMGAFSYLRSGALQGSALAQAGATGAMISGSPADVLAHNTMMAGISSALAENEGTRAAMGLRGQAANFFTQGEAAMQEGRNSMIASGLSAATGLLSTFGQVAVDSGASGGGLKVPGSIMDSAPPSPEDAEALWKQDADSFFQRLHKTTTDSLKAKISDGESFDISRMGAFESIMSSDAAGA